MGQWAPKLKAKFISTNGDIVCVTVMLHMDTGACFNWIDKKSIVDYVMVDDIEKKHFDKIEEVQRRITEILKGKTIAEINQLINKKGE